MKKLFLIVLAAVAQNSTFAGFKKCDRVDAYGNILPCGGTGGATLYSGHSINIPPPPGGNGGATLFTDRNGNQSNPKPCEENETSPEEPTNTPTPSTTPGPVLGVSVSPQGSGHVTSSGAINCPSACRVDQMPPTQYELYAEAEDGYVFWGWTGCTSVSGNTCFYTMEDENHSIMARFEPPNDDEIYGPPEPPPTTSPNPTSARLTVSVSPSTYGTVTGPGIACVGDCTETLSYGSGAVLTAHPNSGCEVSWNGCTSSSGNSCNVTMMGDKTVGANFRCGGTPTLPPISTPTPHPSSSPTPTPGACVLSYTCMLGADEPSTPRQSVTLPGIDSCVEAPDAFTEASQRCAPSYYADSYAITCGSTVCQ